MDDPVVKVPDTTVEAFFKFNVPVAAPILMVVPAPPKLIVVAVALINGKVV